MIALWLIAVSSISSAQIVIEDGKTYSNNITDLVGGNTLYKFHIDQTKSDEDLAISLTTFSDWSDPDIYVKSKEAPTTTVFEWASVAFGMGSILITPAELKDNTDYFILVNCYTYCRYALTLSYTEEISLIPAIPLVGNLTVGKQAIFKILTGESWANLEIAASARFGDFEMYVQKGDIEPSADNSLPVEHNWHSGLDFKVENPASNEIYRAVIVAKTDTQYTITAITPESTIIVLQASIPVRGNVASGQCNYYYLPVDDPNETVIINLTPFSGDADIYVREGKVPTLVDFDFAARKYGNDTLIIDKDARNAIGKPTGFYYIGICGFIDATYSLTASINKDSFTPLTAGVPETGYVESQRIDLFYIELQGNISYNISMQLTTLGGNPDLYARLCTNYQIDECIIKQEDITTPGEGLFVSKHATGGETINIAHLGSQCPSGQTCKYIIGVAGASIETSHFTVVAMLDANSELTLQEGKPVMSQIQGTGYKYFKYNVFNLTVTQVTFLLTPISGDPDLYVSTLNKPNITSFEQTSRNSATEVDQVSFIKGSNKDDLVATYHVAVYSGSSSSFSLVAKESLPSKNTTIQLYPGHPQKDTVYNTTDSEYRIYYFTARYTDATKQPFRITLTPITGRYSLYAANQLANLDWTTEVFYYNWRSDPESTDLTNSITIDTTDPSYLAETTYLVLVVAEQFTNDMSATYSIVYSVGNGMVTLSENVPYNDQVDEKAYNYYIFPIYYNHEDITFTVTAYSGDPDLYISASPDRSRPTKSDNDFRTNNFGSEVLTLTWDQLKDKCPNLPDQYRHGDTTHCNLYVAVYGYSTSTYVLKVHARRNLPIPVIIGTPEVHQLNKTEEDYFYAIVSPNLPLSVVLQPLTGDPDLFMNIIDPATAGYDESKWFLPTRTNSSYFSQSTVMTDEIDLSTEDLRTKCTSGGCIAVIGVYCFSDSCLYSLTVTQEEVMIIVENQPTYGYVNEGQYVYYSYYCDKEDTDFLIILTPLSDGDPDLFISRGRTERPTLEHYNWVSQTWMGESLLIQKSDHFFSDNNLSMKGTYIIGVYGQSSASFTLTVNNHPTPVIRLTSGNPQIGSLDKDSVAYYSYWNLMYSDILITLTPTNGYPTLVANPLYDWADDFYNRLPRADSYTWSSVQNNDRYIIRIPTNDPSFCTYCSILIAVNTTTTTCQYSITVNNDQQLTVLQNGIPFKANVKQNQWQYYSFQISEPTDFDILTTSYSGDTDAYVGTNKTTTWDTYSWYALSSQKIDHIGVKTTDPNFIVGTYYIAIYGVQDSSFAISIHTRNSYAVLVDGWPVSYSLEFDRNQKVYFQFGSLTYFSGPVFCQLSPLTPGIWPRVYADFQPGGFRKDFPNQFSAKYKFERENYDPLYNELQMVFNETGRVGNLNIAVYGNEDETHGLFEYGEFDIYCSSSIQSTILKVGNDQYDSLQDTITSRRYEVNVNEKGKLEVFLIPCEGKLKLEISTNWTLISQDEPDVQVMRMVDGKIVGSINNAEGKYFIAVSLMDGSKPSATYELTTVFTKAGEKSPKLIVPGRDGLLRWERKDGKHILIKWDPVQYEDGRPFESPETVEYQIVFTKYEDVQMITACGMHTAAHNDRAEYIGRQSGNSTELVVKMPENIGFINIIAVVTGARNTMLGLVPYDPTEIVITRRTHHGLASVLFWGAAAILLISIFAAIYFYKKFKKVKQELQYEMTDVRNVAAISSGSLEISALSSRNRQYSPLVQES